MILFIDTEISGFPKNGAGLEDPTQARILEIACILTDEQGKVISTLDTLVKCGDIVLREGLPHDITVKDCNEKGVCQEGFILSLKYYFSMADIVVAHNIDFDLKMLALYFEKLGEPKNEIFCTMKAMTDILKIPNKFNNGYKWASLKESADYFVLINRDAHRAMADAEMCKDIYFAIQNMNDFGQIAKMMGADKLTIRLPECEKMTTTQEVLGVKI